MRDSIQGWLLLAFSILAVIAYFWAIFLAPSNAEFLGRAIWEWALIIPVMLIVFLFLLVIAWIGWAMITTPPTIPTNEKNTEKKEEKKTTV